MIDKHTNPLVIYLEGKLKSSRRTFIQELFHEIPEASKNQIALVIAADIAEKDMILPLQKGYDLIAFDSQLVYYDLFIPDREKYKDNKIKIFSDWDFNKLPKLDIVMASFILPLYDRETFHTRWNQINNKIKIGGYFIGNFFDPQWNLFSEKKRKNMIFHTKQEILDLLQNYEVIKIQEVKEYSSKLKGNDYYYEVFAKKII
ncbi:hypothetical protein [Wolbachia endosymbiont of Chironomus riparius]|uniref:hypothetical protein n=1 Tax=Wolbachia endosymbiont of Chironomus riparius TaxID=2883238 RepID=UPI00209FE2EF|nr:hypothetical protein [Wolbachia endosymbiont of Chironomus riparius]